MNAPAPALGYFRPCEICQHKIPDGEIGFGCIGCFLAGKLTLFCSLKCRQEHERREHAAGVPQ